ncbi:hypothetical protein B0H13DRAFT_1897274 [Mycena leptocephala]|nr:hypothetical protein B0H13DRAFT_1897274 [Mycena leptocephala]
MPNQQEFPMKHASTEGTKPSWQGPHKLAQTIELIVPEPFGTPFKIFNAISDAAEMRIPEEHRLQMVMFLIQKYFDNEVELRAMMERLSACLVEANCVLSGATTMASISRRAASNWQTLGIHNIQHLSLTEKTLGPDIAQKINQCLDRLNQGTQEHHNLCQTLRGFGSNQTSFKKLELLWVRSGAQWKIRKADECELRPKNYIRRLEALSTFQQVNRNRCWLHHQSIRPKQRLSHWQAVKEVGTQNTVNITVNARVVAAWVSGQQ